MTLELEQEESIKVLRDIKIIPMGYRVEIRNIGNEKIITRSYLMNNSLFPTMSRVITTYTTNRCTEKIKSYAAYLENDLGDKVYLCQYSPEIINTLFNNIILLEMSNWRRTINSLKPLRNIDDYTSFKFEVSNCDKQLKNLLQKMIEKDTSILLNKFGKYRNTNEVIKTEIWQSLLPQ